MCACIFLHVYITDYSAVRKNETLPFGTLVDLEHTTLNEVSQTQRGKHHMISLKCGINKTNNQKETHK